MNKRVSCNIQSYTALIKTTKQPKTVLKDILMNNDNLESTLSLVYLISVNHASMHYDILNYIESLSIPNDDEQYECEQWLVKIVFIILEHKKHEKCFKILININMDYINFVIDLLNKETGIQTVKDLVFTLRIDFKDHILREIKKSENISFIRNAIAVVVDLYKDIDLTEIEFLLESEHFFLRNAYLDLLYSNLQCGVKFDFDVLEVIFERLNDLNYFVRSKVVHILGLFNNEGILPNKIREIMDKVKDKIHDKTVIVRKRAICFFSNFLIKNDQVFDESNALNEIYGQVFDKVLLLMKSGSSSEYVDILHLLKLSYYYRVKNADHFFETSFELIWDTKSKYHLLGCIKEIIEKVDPVQFFISFAKENENYRKILQSIKFKKQWIDALKTNIIRNELVYESSFVLSNVSTCEIEYNILFVVTKIFFASATMDELKVNCRSYKNILIMILRNIGKDCRCKKEECRNCEIKSKAVTQIWKNIVKMNFLNFEIVDFSLKIIMRNKDFETNILQMLEMLQSKRSHTILVYSLGSIAQEIAHFLDKAENKIKQHKLAFEDTELSNVREKRLSLSRLSLRNTKNQVNNTFIENTVLDNTYIDNTMIFEDLQKRNDKDDISDFIFLIKENKLFFSPDSIFRTYMPLIMQMIESNENSLQMLGFITLYKYMLCSSEFFLENAEYIEKGLENKCDKIKNATLLYLSEFIITYSAWVESYIPKLFANLENGNSLIRKNTLLVIYYMVTNNLLKLKGYGRNISNLLFDNELGSIARKFISQLTENDIIGITFETAIASDFTNKKEVIKYLMKHIEKEKTKEMLIERIKQKNCDEDIIENIKSTMGVSKTDDESKNHEICA